MSSGRNAAFDESAAQQMGALNEEQIRAKIDAEKERERERGGQGAASG